MRTNKIQPGERKTVGELGIPPEKVHHSLVDVVTIGASLKDSKTDNDKSDTKPASTESTMEESVKHEPLEEESKVADASGSNEEKQKVEASHITEDEPVKDFSDTTKSTEEENGELTKADECDAAKVGENDVDSSTGVAIEGGEKVSESEEENKPSKEQADETPSLKEEPESDAAEKSEDSETANGATAPAVDAAKEDDDSDAAVGKEDAAKLDQDLMVEDSDEKDDTSEATNRKVTVMFQKLLSLGGNSGQVSVKLSEEDAAGKLYPMPVKSYCTSSRANTRDF